MLALVFIAVPTLRAIWYQYDVPEDQRDQAVQITATGYQWWFKFEYTQEQIDGAGPLVTANELVIPAGRPVRINLRTTDVIHSFWVPKLAGKVDMIPNRGNHLWLHAERPGYYWGQCAEYCGESHAVMRFRVVALEAGDYARWIAGQKHPARTPAADDAPPRPQTAGPGYVFKNPGRNAPGYSAGFDADPLAAWKKQQAVETGEDPALVAHGRELFRSKNCITCHTTRGHDGVGVNGPDLTHIGARTTIAGGLLENTPQNLHRWIAHPDEVKPGNKMWVGVNGMAGYVTLDPVDNHRIQKQNITVTDDEARALVSYLHSLK
ncbi:cytochrome c oxidase subunit II [Geminisphaera colitermitum]|uniref:cytochrome c oxidase subunit II n=1 Tax=Geminisphaera colitermitum TaxID=1148786 RepID=UPI001E30CD8A|nr:c-type cytochrome [Geminisphaera colitermitum]